MTGTAETEPSLVRALVLRLSSMIVGSVLSLLLLAGLAAAYAGYCRLTGTDARLLRASSFLRERLSDAGYIDLLRLVTAESPDTFETVWDTTDAIKLSREEFVPTEMYGQVKYRYKPLLRYLDAEVWSGLDRQRLSALDSPQMRAAVGRCRVFRQVFIETDERGFKKTEFRFEPGTPVVLFAGDSFTEGLDVASADTFVNLFGRRMRAAGLRGIPVNTGVNGYGTLEECWTVERYAVELGARVVVENLFPNDVESNYPEVIRGVAVPEERYTEMFHYLDRMWDHCRAHGIALVIAVIPAKEQMDRSQPESPFEPRVRSWCQERRIPFLSPLAVFRAHGAAEIYFPVDPHLNEHGHAVYAHFLFEQCLPTLRRALE